LMAELVNEISVVKKLWNLSSEPNNQPYIVRRNILPALIKFLQSKDPQVSQLAAETLKLLSSHPDNPEYICREKGLLQTLVKVYKAEQENETLKSTLAAVLRNLHSAVPTDSSHSKSEDTEKTSEEQKHICATLKVKSPSENIEKILLQIKGVFSCTYNAEQKQARVWSKFEPKELIKQITSHCELKVELAEDEIQTEYQRSLVVCGENSLSARLARQREEKRKAKEDMAAQDGMTSFFRRISAIIWT
jgi:hypothetical protein